MTTSNRSASASSVVVQELNAMDVLLGRGTGPNDHQGNQLFRDLVDSRLRIYTTARGHEEQERVIRNTIALVHSRGGRFMRKVDSQMKKRDKVRPATDMVSSRKHLFEVITDTRVLIYKTKQAFRYSKSKFKGDLSTCKDDAAVLMDSELLLSLSMSSEQKLAAVQQASLNRNLPLVPTMMNPAEKPAVAVTKPKGSHDDRRSLWMASASSSSTGNSCSISSHNLAPPTSGKSLHSDSDKESTRNNAKRPLPALPNLQPAPPLKKPFRAREGSNEWLPEAHAASKEPSDPMSGLCNLLVLQQLLFLLGERAGTNNGKPQEGTHGFALGSRQSGSVNENRGDAALQFEKKIDSRNSSCCAELPSSSAGPSATARWIAARLLRSPLLMKWFCDSMKQLQGQPETSATNATTNTTAGVLDLTHDKNVPQSGDHKTVSAAIMSAAIMSALPAAIASIPAPQTHPFWHEGQPQISLDLLSSAPSPIRNTRNSVSGSQQLAEAVPESSTSPRPSMGLDVSFLTTNQPRDRGQHLQDLVLLDASRSTQRDGSSSPGRLEFGLKASRQVSAPENFGAIPRALASVVNGNSVHTVVEQAHHGHQPSNSHPSVPLLSLYTSADKLAVRNGCNVGSLRSDLRTDPLSASLHNESSSASSLLASVLKQCKPEYAIRGGRTADKSNVAGIYALLDLFQKESLCFRGEPQGNLESVSRLTDKGGILSSRDPSRKEK